MMKSKVIQGNNIDILKGYPDNYFDSIVTDPPYGIEFLHKDWDNNTGAVETWEECFRVLKPGGYILAFSAARTYHNLATNIESVGFDIRDQLMWLYASGFPKAQDVGKALDKRGVDNEWAGWKTALKPAHEPIVMARKPFKGSCVDNVLTHGVGALNIDATRIKRENEESKFPSNVLGEVTDYQKFFYCPKVSRAERHCGFESAPSSEKMLEDMGGYFVDQEGNRVEYKNRQNVGMVYIPHIGTTTPARHLYDAYTEWSGKKDPLANIPTTSGGMYDDHGTGKMYSIGTDMKSKVDPLAHIPKNPDGMLDAHYKKGEKGNPIYNNQKTSAGNNHPTVKPVALMKYLLKLVTPEGGKVLDPFTGSGSTGMAAVELDYDFTGCELDPDYVDIANRRIEAWYKKTDTEGNKLPEIWFEEK